jgi:DUF4097 and DUF4098 domain-containing protein YvlB
MQLIPLVLLAMPVHAGNINKSISIEAGTESGHQSSVNGSITVGSKAIVRGSLETVNGAIRVDDGAMVQDLETVNGSITVGGGERCLEDGRSTTHYLGHLMLGSATA